MCLKTVEQIDKGKDKKHTGKLTSNPDDMTLILHVGFDERGIGMRLWHAAVLLSKRRFRIMGTSRKNPACPSHPRVTGWIFAVGAPCSEYTYCPRMALSSSQPK